mgnify:CR=1 FL=1
MINTVMMCLALNIFFEARNQPLQGQVAVTQVVLNRVSDPEYPDKICDVVFQAQKNKSGRILRNRCQFSWFCDGKSDVPHDIDALRWANHVAISVLYGLHPDITNGATHYHSNKVRPKWAVSMKKTVEIGDHMFFKKRKEL